MVTATVNPDHFRERLRERLQESDDYDITHCLNCTAQLTSVDQEAGECTNCRSGLVSGDKTLNEHLWDDEDQTWVDFDEDIHD